MSGVTEATARGRVADILLDRIAAILAMVGGCLSLGLAMMVVASITLRSRWVGGSGVPGDFELAQMMTAVSVFCFLPLCQARRGHVIVDAVSQDWPAAWRGRVDSLWEVVAGLALGLVAWQLEKGASGMVQSNTRTMVLGISIAPAVWACTILCGFLAVLTFWRGVSGLFSTRQR